ncbi:MAG: hypothetical protein II160_05135 [Selenomonas sp.]|nr:hypothetical protein [Selenomonas sp.]
MDEQQAKVSAFSYEGVLAALERSNKRLLIALVVTCITLVIAVGVVIFGNAVNNRVWMDYVYTIQEDSNAGVYQQPNIGADK